MENKQEYAEGGTAETAELKAGDAAADKTADGAENGAGAETETPASAEQAGTEREPAGLTEEEKRLVRNYALNDGEVRRIIIGDYLNRLKSPGAAPPVMQGDAGGSPVMAPRTPRDMREAAVLAEALLKKR